MDSVKGQWQEVMHKVQVKHVKTQGNIQGIENKAQGGRGKEKKVKNGNKCKGTKDSRATEEGGIGKWEKAQVTREKSKGVCTRDRR